MTDPNPYEPPPAPVDPGSFAPQGDKERRTNLINRRTTALLLETSLHLVTFGVLLRMLAARVLPPDAAPLLRGAFVMLPLYACRDLLGPMSPGKRLVGLGLEYADGRPEPVGAWARVVRNLPLAVPLASLVEYLVAYYGNDSMQRLGDLAARTRIVDRAPERFGRASFSWQMLCAVVLSALAFVASRSLAGD